MMKLIRNYELMHSQLSYQMSGRRSSGWVDVGLLDFCSSGFRSSLLLGEKHVRQSCSPFVWLRWEGQKKKYLHCSLSLTVGPGLFGTAIVQWLEPRVRAVVP